MPTRAELEELRRLDELEARRSGRGISNPAVQAGVANRYAQREQEIANARPMENFINAVGEGIGDVGVGLAQRTGMASQEYVDQRKERQAPLLRTKAGALGHAVGTGTVMAPAAFIPGANTVIGSAALGAGMGALTPTATGESVGDNMFSNAVAGGAGTGLIKTLARVARPINPTQQAQRLIDQGVHMTPGQAAGGGYKKTEDVLTSLPFVGDAINYGRRQALKQFNSAAFNRGNVGMLPAGNQGADMALDMMSQRYDDILPRLRLKATPELEKSFLSSAIRNKVRPADMHNIEDFVAQDYVPSFTKQPDGSMMMTGSAYKELDTALRQQRGDFTASSSPMDKRVGRTFGDVRRELRNALETQTIPDPNYVPPPTARYYNNPNDLPAVSGTGVGEPRQFNGKPGKPDMRQAYDPDHPQIPLNDPQDIAALKQLQVDRANLQPAIDATGSVAADNRGGIFTPAAYASQVRKMATENGHKQHVARGMAANQEFAQDANAVLGNDYADSGTALRNAVGAMVGGAIGMSPAGVALPIAYGVGALGTRGLMSDVGRKYMVGGFSPMQGKVSNFLRKHSGKTLPFSLGTEDYLKNDSE